MTWHGCLYRQGNSASFSTKKRAIKKSLRINVLEMSWQGGRFFDNEVELFTNIFRPFTTVMCLLHLVTKTLYYIYLLKKA